MIGIWHLITREIAHRRGSFALSVAGVVLAITTLVASLGLLRAHDLRMAVMMATMNDETQARMADLQDDYRKIVLQLGFNVYIVPKGVEPSAAYIAEGGHLEMPESHAQVLADAGVITINHLLPSLTQRVEWQGGSILIKGIRSEMTARDQKAKKPLIQPVTTGEAVVGYVVAQQAKVSAGDKLTILDRMFTIKEVHAYRGNSDDITAWLNLTDAQMLLNKPGKINAIQAINCLAPQCYPDATGMPAVEDEISRVLPDTQVLVDVGKAKTRIDARERAATEALAAMQHEAARLAAVRSQLAGYASIAAPLSIAVACLWVGLLASVNVRGRIVEIGVLRALGLDTSHVLTLFLGRAALAGIAGALPGCALGLIIAGQLGQVGPMAVASPSILIASTAGAPILAMLAAWLPALSATQQVPANVLVHQ